jgi:hypothetical protein
MTESMIDHAGPVSDHDILLLREFLFRNGNAQAAFFLASFLASASTSTPMMSLSFIMRYSTPSILTSVPDHLPNKMR